MIGRLQGVTDWSLLILVVTLCCEGCCQYTHRATLRIFFIQISFTGLLKNVSEPILLSNYFTKHGTDYKILRDVCVCPCSHCLLTCDRECLNNSIIVVNRHVHVCSGQNSGVTPKLECCYDSWRTVKWHITRRNLNRQSCTGFLSTTQHQHQSSHLVIF